MPAPVDVRFKISETKSVNDYTNQASLTKPDYVHCEAVATEIFRVKHEHPNAEIDVMAGDVASSVYLFTGRIEKENVIVIELSEKRSWLDRVTWVLRNRGAISHVHGSQYNAVNPAGFFNHHWVDDHTNVTANIAILGAEAINDEKFTPWKTHQRVLGLEFDSVAETISIPASNISKARNIVASAYFDRSLTRKNYRSLMGSLRHAFALVGISSSGYGNLHRFQTISVTEGMKQVLPWWWLVFHDPQLNRVSLEYFNSLPLPNVVVEVDASNLTYAPWTFPSFSPVETALISYFKSVSSNGFDINFRELLSFTFAVNE
ncbi:LOW QUALITY PROTEIN: hypothetical protein PHMEG_0002368 [Phytophthora megakarya]|uniref:Uncharacterized protein n=1 Tax=Phytophthora megakarya TaxID=4795 RepID=A0A225X0U3_9STRA|nr:LOW QUALITY PROTEIN: hypothetical protein PHMEG_0002368 [Phytophthora megakarya]